MGRVRTKTVKRAARQIVEKYYPKLTGDFQINKKITEEVASIPSKRLRNKISGFVTHLMCRIKKGSVRGISLKLQEAEREKRQDDMPARSVTDPEGQILASKETCELLKALNVKFSFKEPSPEQAGMAGGRPQGGFMGRQQQRRNGDRDSVAV